MAEWTNTAGVALVTAFTVEDIQLERNCFYFIHKKVYVRIIIIVPNLVYIEDY